METACNLGSKTFPDSSCKELVLEVGGKIWFLLFMYFCGAVFFHSAEIAKQHP